MDVVKKIQSTPGPAARILEDLEFYEATWPTLEVLPFELAKRLTDYHEHRGFGQSRQGGDHGIGLRNGFPVGHGLAVEGEEYCYDCKQCSYADYHGE
jgi:hypothetical protein